jgi:hypothetical protein
MRVMCVDGYEGLLTEGNIYTVIEVTSKGNFILEEVSVPEGFTSFDFNRFVPVQDTDDMWNEELEEQFLAEQP